MTKQDLERRLSANGMFLSTSEVARALGMMRETVKKLYLDNLEFIRVGKAKKYYSGDVAKAIYESREQS